MRELGVIDWFAAAFVVAILVFAFQPLIWIRTIKGLSDAISWCQAIEITGNAARNRCGYGLGLTYTRWDDLSCEPWCLTKSKFVIYRTIHRIWTFHVLLWNVVIATRAKRGGE